MSTITIKEALVQVMTATKKYVDSKLTAESEYDTLNKMLEYNLVHDAIALEDGTYLTDENDNLLQL